MRNACDAILKLAAHDPVIASGLVLLSLVVVPLGGLHLARIFGGFFVLVIREFKHELHAFGKLLAAIWRELTTWKTWKVDE
jgi:hypothetical protein